ncbi:hypothetical protein ACJROX_22815 [Pseudalkalibacillus sp. A8]|uniref:hypothetical protein n=1 Tax=Pseudalkalibacillus sp. A8 TaxID=3382641 RepID=UPI0038B6AD22
MQNQQKYWLHFWKQLFAPNQSLRFFPPHFWLRNPVTPILKKSYRCNRTHVVVVFDVHTYKHQIEQFGMTYVQQFENDVRRLFKRSFARQ